MSDIQRYYNRVASTYTEKWFDYSLNFLTKEFLSLFEKGDSILDVGCGPGRESHHFNKRGFDAYGVDISFRMLKEGEVRGVKKLICANMKELPFKNSTFCGIWACASLIHVPYQFFGEVFSELIRVLKPEGYMFCSIKEGTESYKSTSHSGIERTYYLYNLKFMKPYFEKLNLEIVRLKRNLVSTQDYVTQLKWMNIILRLRSN